MVERGLRCLREGGPVPHARLLLPAELRDEHLDDAGQDRRLQPVLLAVALAFEPEVSLQVVEERLDVSALGPAAVEVRQGRRHVLRLLFASVDLQAERVPGGAQEGSRPREVHVRVEGEAVEDLAQRVLRPDGPALGIEWSCPQTCEEVVDRSAFEASFLQEGPRGLERRLGIGLLGLGGLG